jgi:Family of unknown function (DUF6298)/Putative collagen-binding domain of a collagenase
VRSVRNPRYFEDGRGNVVYLTGSHTWNNLQDLGKTDPPPAFDFTGYLDWLDRHHHNFFRLWGGQLPTFRTSGGARLFAIPHPWLRSGSGLARDGKPRFDLTSFDPLYFSRLRARLAEAGRRGFYVAIVLFEGWNIEEKRGENGWFFHPFHAPNNVNDVAADVDADGWGREFFTLEVPGVVRLQEAYVRKVVDTVNDLDNVLYEVVNEGGAHSTAWQYHMIDLIQRHERTKPKRHPVGMTFQAFGGSTNRPLFESPADWVSPAGDEDAYKDRPPAADGTKVVLSDTDHLWGVGGDRAWAWKSFARGLNPIFMDPYGQEDDWRRHPSRPHWDDIRRSMGYTRVFARRLNLAAAVPRADLASTGYCLADPGREYLVYVPAGPRRWFSFAREPAGEAVRVDLTAAAQPLGIEWFNPRSGERIAAGRARAGGWVQFSAPWSGDAVLYLSRGIA